MIFLFCFQLYFIFSRYREINGDGEQISLLNIILILTGVPQSSILGLLLLSLYIKCPKIADL